MTRSQVLDGGTLPRISALLGVVALLVSVMALPARAVDGFELVIPIDTVVRNVGVGSVTPLETVAVPEENQGELCAVSAHAENQRSVHPGNDLIVQSGSDSGVLEDVERESGGVTEAPGTLTLGETIVVSLRMGEDDVFSAGFDIIIDCTAFRWGRIIVEKQVSEGADTEQSFDFTASYDADGFSLAAGETNDSGQIDNGTYSVMETVPEGWILDSVVCDDGSSPDSIEITSQKVVTCTFTNAPEPPDEVEAAIVVDVDTTCTVVDENSVGELVISVSVDGGATVVVRDSDGDVVATVTEDARIDAEPGATYTWQATPSEGFEFPAGSAASGTVTVEDCVASLPFTGANDFGLAFLAAALVLTGSAVLYSERKRVLS